MKLNSQLQRQVSDHFGKSGVPDAFQSFLGTISQTYDLYEKEVSRLERWRRLDLLELMEWSMQLKKEKMESARTASDLAERNKDLQQFAYIVSHNLRSPIANIIGITDLVGDKGSINNAEKELLLKGMGMAARKLDQVMRDLDSILQVRKEVHAKKELVKFSDITTDIETLIQNMIKKEKAVIKTDFKAINSCMTSKTYLNSIFLNLISNSIKYRRAEAAPLIEIRSKKVKNKIVLLFKDNGLGIDLESHGNKVFGLYKKFHVHQEGKGMGLYMVKTQVEMLGGKIEIKSELNKGTEFLIELAS